MLTIYLEPNLLTLETADEAATQLRYLAESGARLVVLADDRPEEWVALAVPGLRFASAVEDGRRGDWWLTADPAACARRPAAGVRSLLIGGAQTTADAHTARCDLVARDLRSAVLEILSVEAMPDLAASAVR